MKPRITPEAICPDCGKPGTLIASAYDCELIDGVMVECGLCAFSLSAGTDNDLMRMLVTLCDHAARARDLAGDPT